MGCQSCKIKIGQQMKTPKINVEEVATQAVGIVGGAVAAKHAGEFAKEELPDVSGKVIDAGKIAAGLAVSEFLAMQTKGTARTAAKGFGHGWIAEGGLKLVDSFLSDAEVSGVGMRYRYPGMSYPMSGSPQNRDVQVAGSPDNRGMRVGRNRKKDQTIAA